MISGSLLENFPIILTALSLIITIIGWSVTYRTQRQILERQIEADLEKQKDSLFLSLTFEKLNTIAKWVRKGYEIVKRLGITLDDVGINDIEEDCKDWTNITAQGSKSFVA